jgi:peptide/nickel transport system substrate-binding protein
MRQHRCALGPDRIWSCGGIRASVRFATTSGNATRALIQQRMVDDARAAGIELVPDNSTAGVLFGTRLPARDYELIMFAWPLGGTPNVGLGVFYGCDGASNFLAYCSERVTGLLANADEDDDPTVLLRRADALLAEDVPSLPLFQHPLFLAHQQSLSGIEMNAGPQTLTWNVEEWRIE